MSLSRITELAKEDGERQFYSIAHFLTPETLFEAFRSLRKDASAGVDDVTYEDYAILRRFPESVLSCSREVVRTDSRE